MAKHERRRGTREGEGFWDQPPTMNLVSDLLIAFALITLGLAAVALLPRLPIAPLRQLVVVSGVDRVHRAHIEHAARTALAGNLMGVDLDVARTAFANLPWVRSASLRRRWPDALELTIEEHVAVARWTHAEDAQRLVNTHGEIFTAAAGDNLPVFAGPEGAAALMLERYREFDAGLAQIQRKAVALTLTTREAWQIRLDDGVLLDLGRDQPKLPLAGRLDRFVIHYAAAREQVRGPIAAVDMRYPNGFALRLGAPTTAESKSKES